MKFDKLELGCGQRPTDGFLHQDITKQPGVELDFECQPWEIPLEADSLSQVIALGIMEHLRFAEVRMTSAHVLKILKPKGIFLFEVPDITIWSEYLYNVTHGMPEKSPFSKEHVYSTFWGWQRWAGDEHKSAWLREDIIRLLREIGFSEVTDTGPNMYLSRGLIRNRFYNSADAHIYIEAVK